MLFIFNDQKYMGDTAVGIVRELERAALEYQPKGGSIGEFLSWSLEEMADRIPPREIDVSPNLDDETIAFNYLCLLDSLRIGTICEPADSRSDLAATETSIATSD
jgi:hypothetical protein